MEPPANEEEVVISGISGTFPYSNNMDELRDNLFNKVTMTSSNDCRWHTRGDFDIPNSTGKINNVSKFDASHFGLHRKLTESFDPMMYITLEKSYEAVLDAGVNPNSLKGSKTSVIMSSCFSEADSSFDYGASADGFGIVGHSRSMLATRVAYYLDIKGASYTILNSWSGGITAITQAYTSIRRGVCSAALVGASSLALFPQMSDLFNKLGLLSPDGLTRSFDAEANGYGRSEATVVLYLQRKRDAKRVYAEILHSNVFCYGDRDCFISPSQTGISRHLKHFYETCHVNPADIQYLEADGSACNNNDVIELNAVEEVMLPNRKTPLLIGSVKSNIGHTEATSSICSIAKVLIAMESGHIPPNLNYNNPISGVPSLTDGRIKVVTEKLPWLGGLAAINSFGMDGNYGHLLLRSHSKGKTKKTDAIPRLIIISSRTEEAVHKILTKIESMPPDPEFTRLLHDIHDIDVYTHLYRGYTIVSHENEPLREVQHYEGAKRPIWFIFSGMGSQWPGMACHLLQLPVFAAAIDRCHAVLEPKGLNLKRIVTEKDPKIFDNILNCFVGIAAMQIGLVAVLNRLGIVPDGMIGHSVGELGCALADGCFTEEEMILAAYYRGRSSIESDLITGMMAAVGMGARNLRPILPSEIAIACHNGPDSCTISGPALEMEAFVGELNKKGIFARLVNVANIPYHSQYIKPAGPKLLKYLRQVILEPKLRSTRWISTSVPEKDWDSPLCQFSSPDYHTNNLLSPVLFEEGILHIPKNAICIEIAPHGLLQAILRRSLDPGCFNVSLTQRGHNQGLTFLLQAIGKLYMLGLQPKVAEIYPAVSLPVSRGTPSISSLVEWEHSDDWPILSFLENKLTPGETNVILSLTQEETCVYKNHVIGDHIVLPAAAHLKLAWTILASILNKNPDEMSIVFENIIFHQAVLIPKQGSIELHFLLQRGSGMFEIMLNDKIVTTGQIIIPENIDKEFTPMEPIQMTSWTELSQEDVYKELHNRGYKYAGEFQAITSARLSKTCSMATIKWNNNWVAFTDCLLQLAILQKHEDSQDLCYPTFLRKFVVNVNLQEMQQELEAVAHRTTGIVSCKGMEFQGLETKSINLGSNKHINFQLYEQRFVNHQQPSFKNIHEFIEAALQLALENYHPSNKDRSHVIITELKNNYSLLPLVKDVTKNLLDTWVETETIVWPNIKELKKNCVLVLTNEALASEGTKLLADSGALLLARIPNSIIWQPDEGMVVIMEQNYEEHRILLLRKETDMDLSICSIIMEGDRKVWLKQIKDAIQVNRRIYLISYKNPPCGIPSFLNNLSKDCHVQNIRCFFILDKSAPPFSLSQELFQKQLTQDLAINVYLEGHWGTYRSLPIIEKSEKRMKCSKIPFRLNENDVHYVSATVPELPQEEHNNTETESHVEYSGINNNGDKVMGLALTKPLKVTQHLTWLVPESWSLEEAATVPEAYSLAYYIVKHLGKVQAEDNVLIHMGYTPVSQAAIRVALSVGAKVFTTVTSNKQQQFIKEHFPQLSDSQILDTKSTMFEYHLLEATEGKGMSLVINGQTAEKLSASLRCLNLFGLMIQIGKEKFSKIDQIGMTRFLKSTALHGVTTAKMMNTSEKCRKQIHESVQEGITSGTVKPLERIVCHHDEADKVTEFLTDPTLSQKVLFNIRPEIKKEYFIKQGMLRCSQISSYLIFGGKGDDWLSLVVWLVQRGARKFVIAQQSQPITNYLARQVELLRTCHAADIKLLSAHSAATPLGASKLVKEANSNGSLAAIFILPLQSREATENSEWDMSTSHAVNNLDTASRSTPIQHFVCLQCKGVERILENRHRLGFPSLSLQYGVQLNPQADLHPILLKMDNLLTRMHKPIVIVNSIHQETDTVSSYMMVDRFNYLLTASIRDLVDLGKSFKGGTAVEEVASLSPGLDFARESTPVFMVPSLQPSSVKALEPLFNRLLSPTFLLKVQEKRTSLQEYATQLLQHVKQIRPAGPYIFVGDMWGGVVAIELAQQLESQGHHTQVFLLDGAPGTLQKTIGQLGQGNQFEPNFLMKLFNVTSDKVREKLSNLHDWESWLNTILDAITFEDDAERSQLTTAVEMLYSHIRNSATYTISHKIEGPVTLILPNGSEGDNCGLLKFCKQTVNIHVIGEDHNTMLASSVTADTINNNLLVK